MNKIPKIIHYCWFGGKPKPDIFYKCLESWGKYLPDFKIVEWNEDNFDINCNNYVKEAYSNQKWAFVSDYVRLYALYNYGGVYLDIDVEFIKPLHDEYLLYDGILAFEHTKTIAPGLIFGSKKNNSFVKDIMQSYELDNFVNDKSGIFLTINMRITNELMKFGLELNNESQLINGFYIFPSEYFCGYNTDIREPEITENTIAWHHYLGSWSKKTFKTYFQDFLKSVIGVENYKKLFYLVRRFK